MKKIIRRVFIIIFSVIGAVCLLWIVLLFYPGLSYTNQTQIGQVTVFHNKELPSGIGDVIKKAVEIIKESDLYDKDLNIQLCLNDDRIYPNLYPIQETPAYAIVNKTILKKGDFKFNENLVEIYWEQNNFLQVHDLTWLLAHEFTHTLQNNANLSYVWRTTFNEINWKLEGHADYIAKKFKNNGSLKGKIDDYLKKCINGEDWVIIVTNKDGSKQSHSYYKYSLMVQYLMEIKNMNYYELCESNIDKNQIYSEMIEWAENSNNSSN